MKNMSRSIVKTAYVYKTMPSPIGGLRLVGSDRGLAAIVWENGMLDRVGFHATLDVNHPVLLETHRQLEEYFAGKRKTFDLTLEFVGTDFQKRVWNALLRIPFGQTRTYGEIARQLGNANAMRAVGAANGQNPIPIVAPCHRVIGASGALIGFGGGLETKAYLLNLERGMTAFDFEGAKTAADRAVPGKKGSGRPEARRAQSRSAQRPA
jgi:methylated-DNA-[protein]-cysteine S-methyltransferase